MTKYIINEELNGIKIYFDAKPNTATIETLKADKWRWHRAKKCWYNRNNETNIKTAIRLANGNTAEPTAPAPKQENEFGVKVGDMFYCSWGYEQTNIDFFQVVALKGKKSVLLREVSPTATQEQGISGMSREVAFDVTSEILPPTNHSVFIKDNEKGDLKRIQGTKENYHIKLESYAYAYPYHGESLYESWYA